MEGQPTLEGMDTRSLLESMEPDAIVNYILAQGERISLIEREMNLASEVLEGAYGLTVEQVLAEREQNKNGTI